MNLDKIGVEEGAELVGVLLGSPIETERGASQIVLKEVLNRLANAV